MFQIDQTKDTERFGCDLDFLYKIYLAGGPIEPEYAKVTNTFNSIMHKCQDGILSKKVLNNFLGATSAAWLTPYTMQGFATVKPNGYAGCFETIERIYTYWHSPVNTLRKWDEYFHSLPAPNAVRNRAIILNEIVDSINHNNLRILNLGCGPGIEFITTFLSHFDKIEHLDFVDIDNAALIRCKMNLSSYVKKIQFTNKNVLRFKTEMKYDLIWSSGLFDYLNDNLFIYMLRKLKQMLKDNGLIVIGNFSPANPSRAYMEFGDWNLIHRSGEQLLKIANQAGAKTLRILTENENVNLFLEIQNN